MNAKDELGFRRGTNLYFHGNSNDHDGALAEFASKVMKVILIAKELGVEKRFMHDCEECGFYCLGTDYARGWDLSDDHTIEDLKIYMLQNLLADILKTYFSEDEHLKELYRRNHDVKNIYLVLDLRNNRKDDEQ